MCINNYKNRNKQFYSKCSQIHVLLVYWHTIHSMYCLRCHSYQEYYGKYLAFCCNEINDDFSSYFLTDAFLALFGRVGLSAPFGPFYTVGTFGLFALFQLFGSSVLFGPLDPFWTNWALRPKDLIGMFFFSSGNLCLRNSNYAIGWHYLNYNYAHLSSRISFIVQY